MEEIINKLDELLWGVPLIALILTCGILLSAKLRFIQFRKLRLGFKYMFRDDQSAAGEVSGFAALCTALSATVGTGNIVGVATAVTAGGAGALFWMELAALLGMATKYAEGLLAVKYRVTDAQGSISGGPFCYIENGMGSRWKWLAKLFALFGTGAGLLGIGTVTQVHGISAAVQGFFDPEMNNTAELFGQSYSISTIISGAVVTFLAALVIIGGIKRISRISELVVPAMIVIYTVTCLTVLITHFTEIPAALAEIFTCAFGLRPIAGGLTGFSVVLLSARCGIARGIFSNEAGLGSAPIAAAAAKTNEPVRQGLVSMTGTFIDTIVVCTMTGLVIIISGSHNADLTGVAVTAHAFGRGLPLPDLAAQFILMICLSVFAFTTILGWNYYSERCLSYLTGSRRWITVCYRWVYIAAVFIGPYLTAEAVWGIANLTALFVLSGDIKKETDAYFARSAE